MFVYFCLCVSVGTKNDQQIVYSREEDEAT